MRRGTTARARSNGQTCAFGADDDLRDKLCFSASISYADEERENDAAPESIW